MVARYNGCRSYTEEVGGEGINLLVSNNRRVEMKLMCRCAHRQRQCGEKICMRGRGERVKLCLNMLLL